MSMTYNDYVIDEYNRAYVHYQAMKALKDGLTPTPTPTPDPEPTPTPTPTPTPDPEPTPEPTPTPTTSDPEIVYNGSSAYTVGVGESTTITFYGMNSTNFDDFAVEMNGAFGTMPVFKYKIKQSRVDNGCRFDFVVTGNTNGTGSITMNPHSGKNVNQKIRVLVNVK